MTETCLPKLKLVLRTYKNMIETQKLTQDNDQVYGRFNVAMKDITS